MDTKVVWQEGMAFSASLNGFDFIIDADTKVGGQNRGPRPKGLVAIALAGCTAMDVISILKKMKVTVKEFEVVTDPVFSSEHPKKYEEPTTEQEPPPPTPPITLSPEEEEKRRQMNLSFYNGPKHKYRVKYYYRGGFTETLTVEARSLDQAINRAQKGKTPQKRFAYLIDIQQVT